MRSSALARVRPRSAPAQAARRYASAGADLRSGEPLTAAELRPGILDFRTPILILALQPVIDPAQFANFLNENLRSAYGVSLMSCGVSVGEPFWQALPQDNRVLGEALVTLGAAQVVGVANLHVGAGTTALGLAELFGWLAGSAANEIANATRVVARWLTIAGTIDSRSRVTTPGEVTDCIASALVSGMRFRHPENGTLLDSQAESVLVRTMEPGACTGARRFDKVIAAACTRVWPSSRPAPAAPVPAQQPGPAQPTQAPPRVEVRPPEPEAPVAWEGEGTVPPIPDSAHVGIEPSGGSTPSRVKSFLVAHRKPIAGALVLATAAGLAIVFWPRRRPQEPAAGASRAVRAP